MSTGHTLLVLTACTAAAGVGASANLPMSSGNAAVSIQLLTVEEFRSITVNKRDDDAGLVFGGTEPGLTLTFKIQPPQGKRLLEVDQPARVVARDSAGTDLSDIEEGFRGQREYAKLAHAWGDDQPETFTFRLSTPARRAESFSVEAEFDAVLYESLRDLTVEVGGDWVVLDAAHFGGEQIRARFTRSRGFFGEGVALEMQPASVNRYLEKISGKAGEDELTSSGYGSDGRTISYMFNEETEAARATITLKVRAGLQAIPIRINLANQPLP